MCGAHRVESVGYTRLPPRRRENCRGSRLLRFSGVDLPTFRDASDPRGHVASPDVPGHQSGSSSRCRNLWRRPGTVSPLCRCECLMASPCTQHRSPVRAAMRRRARSMSGYRDPAPCPTPTIAMRCKPNKTRIYTIGLWPWVCQGAPNQRLGVRSPKPCTAKGRDPAHLS